MKKWLRQNIFTPWKVLKVMDLARGSCNYKRIEVLRSFENGGKRYYSGSVIPSTAEIESAARLLENKEKKSYPFKKFKPSGASLQNFVKLGHYTLLVTHMVLQKRQKGLVYQFLNPLMQVR